MSIRRTIHLAGCAWAVGLCLLPMFAMGQSQQATDSGMLLLKARESFRAGRYEQARKRYQRVIDLEPNNRAAFKGLVQTDREIERTASGQPSSTEGTFHDPASARVYKKLEWMIVPPLTFDHIRLADAVETLRRESVRLDTDGQERSVSLGVSAVVPAWADSPVTIHLENVSMLDALRQLGAQADLKLKVDAEGAQLVGCMVDDQPLLRREFRVSPDLFGKAVSEDERKEILKAAGVQFPPGASVEYFPDSQKLIMRNTQGNLDLIEPLEAVSLSPATSPTVSINP